jgi:hypothetical protein
MRGSCGEVVVTSAISPTINKTSAECAYAKISFTFSLVCWLRDGFRYLIVLSMSE